MVTMKPAAQVDLKLYRQELEALRHEYDELGSGSLERLQAIQKTVPTATGCPKNNTDLYAALQDHHSQDETLQKLWDEINTVPEWVDWAQIARGQDVFYRYLPANLMGFGFQTFMGESIRVAGLNDVLVRTGGFTVKILLHRLVENFQFLLQATKSVAALQPGGEGHISAIRVRFLHAAIRQRIFQLTQTRPEYFDADSFGPPANHLDMTHALTALGCNLMFVQLPIMGIRPAPQEIDDIIALWRYVGYLSGVPVDCLATTAKAKLVMDALATDELYISLNSQVVAHNFVQCVENLPPGNISKDFIEACSRVFNGDAHCDALGFGRPGWYSYACFRGIRLITKTLVMLQRTIPFVDGVVTEYFRRTMHRAVIEEGLNGGIVFHLKYVPKHGKLTRKEFHNRPSPTGLLARPFEAFLFALYVGGIGLVSAALLFLAWLVYNRLLTP